MRPEQMVQKLRAYSHVEHSNSNNTNATWVAHRIQRGEDILDCEMDKKKSILTISDYFPEYVQKNWRVYREFILR